MAAQSRSTISASWPVLGGKVGAASALAGALLLASSLWADLALHNREGHVLLQQLSPQAARIVAEHEAREEANPWHRSLMAGEAFLIVGLAALYLTERARRVRDQHPLDVGSRESGGGPPRPNGESGNPPQMGA